MAEKRKASDVLDAAVREARHEAREERVRRAVNEEWREQRIRALVRREVPRQRHRLSRRARAWIAGGTVGAALWAVLRYISRRRARPRGGDA